GTRSAGRLPGTTSPATDLALSRGLARPLGVQRRPTRPRHDPPHPPPTPPHPPSRHPPTSSPSCSFLWKEACHGPRYHLADRHGRRHLGGVLPGLPPAPVPRRQVHRRPGVRRPPLRTGRSPGPPPAPPT